MIKQHLSIFLFFLAFQNSLAAGVFNYAPVKFFDESQQSEAINNLPADISLKNNTQENFWTEPIITPDGKVAVYTPPKLVLEFIENPTQETAKTYYEWNQARIKQIGYAQGILNQYLRNKEMKKEPLLRRKKPLLVFFLLAGCEMCTREIPVVEQIFSRPDIDIKVFGKGFTDKELKNFPFPVENDKGESIIFGVTTYPSMYGIRRTGERFVLTGIHNGQEILEAAL